MRQQQKTNCPCWKFQSKKNFSDSQLTFLQKCKTKWKMSALPVLLLFYFTTAGSTWEQSLCILPPHKLGHSTHERQRVLKRGHSMPAARPTTQSRLLWRHVTVLAFSVNSWHNCSLVTTNQNEQWQQWSGYLGWWKQIFMRKWSASVVPRWSLFLPLWCGIKTGFSSKSGNIMGSILYATGSNWKEMNHC